MPCLDGCGRALVDAIQQYHNLSVWAKKDWHEFHSSQGTTSNLHQNQGTGCSRRLQTVVSNTSKPAACAAFKSSQLAHCKLFAVQDLHPRGPYTPSASNCSFVTAHSGDSGVMVCARMVGTPSQSWPPPMGCAWGGQRLDQAEIV